MTLIQAWKFVKALNKLQFHYEVSSRNFGFMLAFTALYATLRYFSPLHPDKNRGLLYFWPVPLSNLPNGMAQLSLALPAMR